VDESGGAIGVVGERGRDEEWLAGMGGLPDAVADPAAGGFLILMTAAPAGVAALGDVDEAFAFAGKVGVVVDAEHVAVVVEGDFLDVAEAVGEDFEVCAVGFAAEDAAFVGVVEVLAFLAGDVDAFVADAPVDAAIGADAGAVHVVAGVGDVHAEAVGDDFAFVGDAVVVGIAKTNEVGGDGDVNPAVVVEDAGGDAGDDAVEAFGEDGEFVGGAVVVGVAELVDAFAVNGEVLPVDGAVFVVVGKAAAREACFAGGELAFEEGFFFFDTGEGDVVGDPLGVLADVEVGDFAAGGGGDVDAALGIDGDGDGVGDVEGAGPAVEFEGGFEFWLWGRFCGLLLSGRAKAR
jgi:hypothetical protein